MRTRFGASANTRYFVNYQSKAEIEQIKEAIAILFEPNQVVEVRALGRYGVTSGYFDDHNKLAEAIKRLSDGGQHEGIYYTLNVCQGSLLARYRKNEVHPGVKGTTSDAEVERRHWLLLDFDPQRPKGISSTDEERKAACDLAKQAVRWLTSLGWPQPVLARSGNGYHALYSVNEPNDTQTAELFKKCIGAVAQKFTTDQVVVDKTVFNAAGITKAYGSVTRKGESTDDRPHSCSKILKVPQPIHTVNRAQLEAVAETTSHSKLSSERTESGSVTAEKLEEFMDWAGVSVRSKGDYQDGTRWVLEQCYFNSQHDRGEVCVIQYPNGALKYSCKHDSCCANGWAQFRAAVEDAKGERFRFAELSDYSNKRAHVLDLHFQADSRPIMALAWPAPPTKAAYCGLAGDIVRAIEPHSESDPVALLVQLLVAFGNAIGRGACYRVESDWHYTNLYAILVGDSSKARKGTSWGYITRLFKEVDPNWVQRYVQSGLASGEGLIWAVRDPVERTEQVGRHRAVADMGVEDKRLLVLETEFAKTLKLMGREGNILSTVMRQGWESGDLRSLTKNSPAKATGAHISVIGHITAQELRRHLNETEQANGFGNRNMWICVKRSKFLPDGGGITEAEMASLVQRLKTAYEFAMSVERLERDEEGAKDLWHSVYNELSSGYPGMLGAILGRAEAQVTRLAMLYALLDCSSVIRRSHLVSALALWYYAEASGRYIFGESLGDPVSDSILSALRGSLSGMTRTEISNLFSRHRNGRDIERALMLLKSSGLAAPQLRATGGRAEESWIARGTAR
jgi:hypothetical protein